MAIPLVYNVRSVKARWTSTIVAVVGIAGTVGVFIALAGGFLGLILAYLAIPVIGVALTGLLPPLILSKSLLTLGLGFALFVGAASGLLPGIGAMRMRVVNALRRA